MNKITITSCSHCPHKGYDKWEGDFCNHPNTYPYKIYDKTTIPNFCPINQSPTVPQTEKTTDKPTEKPNK